MNRYWRFVREHWFGILVFCCIIIAFLLRFVNFENRWGLAYDQARDVIVAREALNANKIPLIGPFSSAGQFVYGPQWFWILMIIVGIYPNSVITPWIIQATLYVGVVFLMITIGKEIEGKLFGVLIGLLTAVSSAQIGQSINLTSPSMVGIFSIICVYFFIKYLKGGKNLYVFWMAFSIATAINIHFQAIGLLVLIPLVIVFKKNSLRKIGLLIIGIFIPFIPLIIFDLTNNFFESKNMLQYYFHDQYKISFEVLGRRWLTYSGVFWPNAWAHIIGGYVTIGYIVIICLTVVILYNFFKKTISIVWYAFIISFLSMFVLVRYTRTPLFDSYLTFMHLFVIMLTGWTIFNIYKRNIFLGLVLLAVVIFGSIQKDIKEINGGTNDASLRAESWKSLLATTYPGKNFSIYDNSYRSTGFSLPLVLFLDAEDKISDEGYKIGFGSKHNVSIQPHKEIKGNKVGFVLRDLNSSSSAELSKDGWGWINPSQIYRSTIEWYKK